jgi:hypothetical protein
MRTMNKLLKILGGIFLGLIIVAAVAAAIFIPKAMRLNDDAVAYIAENVPPIVSSWDANELVKRAAPEILRGEGKASMPRLFAMLSKLGALKKMDKAAGNISSGVYPGTVYNGTWGTYKARAEFAAGEAQIDIVLKRDGESWQILGFHVNSPALLNLAPAK